MEATLSLRVPNAAFKIRQPGGLPCLHQARRHHHLGFPKGGAHVGPTRRCAVSMKLPPPCSENTDGRRRRATGAATRAAVVLACALGAANLKCGACAHQLPPQPTPSTSAEATHVAAGGNQTVMHTTLHVLSNISRGRPTSPGPAKARPLLNHPYVELCEEGLALALRNTEKPTLLMELIDDQEQIQSLTEWMRCRRQETANLLQKARTQDIHGKYELRLLLIEVFISQKQYQKAWEVCQEILLFAPDHDARPRLLKAIISMMLAVESMLTPDETSKTEFEKKIKEAKTAWDEFKDIYDTFGKEPTCVEN